MNDIDNAWAVLIGDRPNGCYITRAERLWTVTITIDGITSTGTSTLLEYAICHALREHAKAQAAALDAVLADAKAIIARDTDKALALHTIAGSLAP